MCIVSILAVLVHCFGICADPMRTPDVEVECVHPKDQITTVKFTWITSSNPSQHRKAKTAITHAVVKGTQSSTVPTVRQIHGMKSEAPCSMHERHEAHSSQHDVIRTSRQDEGDGVMHTGGHRGTRAPKSARSPKPSQRSNKLCAGTQDRYNKSSYAAEEASAAHHAELQSRLADSGSLPSGSDPKADAGNLNFGAVSATWDVRNASQMQLQAHDRTSPSGAVPNACTIEALAPERDQNFLERSGRGSKDNSGDLKDDVFNRLRHSGAAELCTIGTDRTQDSHHKAVRGNEGPSDSQTHAAATSPGRGNDPEAVALTCSEPTREGSTIRRECSEFTNGSEEPADREVATSVEESCEGLDEMQVSDEDSIQGPQDLKHVAPGCSSKGTSKQRHPDRICRYMLRIFSIYKPKN